MIRTGRLGKRTQRGTFYLEGSGGAVVWFLSLKVILVWNFCCCCSGVTGKREGEFLFVCLFVLMFCLWVGDPSQEI